MRKTNDIEIHSPADIDGYELNRLVASSPPLDPNSIYCNLLQCSHFKGTSIAAKLNGKLVGFVSGYIVPERPETLFIWQVVVAEAARGKGLAGHMLLSLLKRPTCQNVSYVETTITPSNGASEALFRRFAKKQGTDMQILDGFDKDTHFNGLHESERLWRIGPLDKHITRTSA